MIFIVVHGDGMENLRQALDQGNTEGILNVDLPLRGQLDRFLIEIHQLSRRLDGLVGGIERIIQQARLPSCYESFIE